MFVPIVPTEDVVDDDGKRTKAWANFFEQLAQNMQQDLSDEGFQIPSVSSANDSVTPPAVGGQLAQLAASFGLQNGILPGRLVFDPAEVNGGSLMNPNGQLKIFLADGAFHGITNT